MYARFTTVLALLVFSVAAVASPQSLAIPAGTSVHFKLKQSINTATAKAGTHVPGELTAPIVINGRTVANGAAAATGKFDFEEKAGTHYNLKLKSSVNVTM